MVNFCCFGETRVPRENHWPYVSNIWSGVWKYWKFTVCPRVSYLKKVTCSVVGDTTNTKHFQTKIHKTYVFTVDNYDKFNHYRNIHTPRTLKIVLPCYFFTFLGQARQQKSTCSTCSLYESGTIIPEGFIKYTSPLVRTNFKMLW